MSSEEETSNMKNDSESHADQTIKKLIMSSDAKEFVPKYKLINDETIASSSSGGESKLDETDSRKIDPDYPFPDAGYESHFSCGNVSECVNDGDGYECNNGSQSVPVRPSSLHVSGISDSPGYHTLPMHNPTIYTVESATSPYGMFGSQTSTLAYTRLGGQENINYVAPPILQQSSSSAVVQQTVSTGVFQSYHNSGGSSPHSFASVSPTILANTNNGSSSVIGGEHYVMVHVNLGETFSIRVGDQIQNISGPATVRMVSNSGPPTPMPMQVPPGHMVQQIVDENGILTHVILSPLHQPTQCLGHNVQHVHQSNVQSSFYTPSPNSGSMPMYSSNYNMYTNSSQSQNLNNSPGVSVVSNSNIDIDQNNKPRIDRINKDMTIHGDSIVSSQHGARPPNSYIEGKPRSSKSRGHQYHHPSQSEEPNHFTKGRNHAVSSIGTDLSLTDGIHQDEKSLNNIGYPNHIHYSKIRKKRPFSNSASANTKHHYIHDQASSPASSADEATTILTDEEKKAIRDVLNNIEQPEVSEIEARSALIHIVPPTVPDNCVATICPVDFTFQLHFAERNQDSRYNCVFYGEAVEISLQDLKPSTVYYVKVCCTYESIIGSLSPANKFTTSAAEPNQPKPVQLQTKTRNSVQLKWSSPIENGSKITEYVVEYCKGDSNIESYIQGYRGNAKYCKIMKLKPSTEYLFRLAAINSLGQSPWSESVPIITSGTAPLPPEPPTVARSDIGGLLLIWKKRATDDTFCLEMMDEATGYGFITVFNGPEVEHYVENLRRNTCYKFHLAASNQDGRSKWSDVVTISTKPDLPSPPQKLHARGKINPTHFMLVWDIPEDDGGLPVINYKLELDVSTPDVTDNDSDRDWVLFYEGLEREYLCKNLVPGSTVLARVSAKSSIGGWGNPCQPISIKLAAMPPGQTSPPRKDMGNKTKGGLFSPGSINLVWEKPENDGGSVITNYELCQWLLKTKSKVSQTSSSTGIVLEEYIEECEEQIVYNGSQLHCQISGLVPGAQYRYRIRAINNAGNGKWSNHLDATSGPSAPEGPSEAPVVICRSPNTATVSWLSPKRDSDSQIIEYHLEMKHKSDSSTDFQLIYSGSNLTYEVKNLQPDSCYRFRIQAINRAGISPYSPVNEITTPASVPSQVTNLRTEIVTMHSIQLSWKEPLTNGSAIISYSIEVTNCNPTSLSIVPSNQKHILQEMFILTCETNEKVIGDLLPDTYYKFRVQAMNVVGLGPFSSIVKASTLSPPPAPPRLDCLNVQSNSIKLRWHNEISARQYYINRLLGCSRPSDKSSNMNLSHSFNELNITQYQLQMSRQPDTGWSNVYTGSLQFHKLGKLLESTSYYFRIMACNEIGDGDYSDPYLIVTEKAAPPPVRAPMIVDISSDSCVIQWSAVRSMNYDPIVYILQLLTISEKDCDYRQVYRGSDTTCRLNSLSPGTEYMTRVCAVRLCSPSTIEPDKNSDSPVHLQKNIHELGKSERTSAKFKDNSSPVTELLGAFSKSVAFTTVSAHNQRFGSSSGSGTVSSSLNPSKDSPTVGRKVHLPAYLSRWLEVIGPFTDNHAIFLILCGFMLLVLFIVNYLQTFLK